MAVDAPAQVQEYGLLIDGKSVPAASGETFETVSPTTNQPIGVMARAGLEDVDRAVAAARRAFDDGPWSRMTPLERSRILHKVADLLRQRLPEIARIETMNCGKIIVESRGDVTASANCFEYYAGQATQLWGEQIPMNGPLLDYTLREPVGVCAQIIPWNFPLLMAAWKLGPALATGNTIILKPASAAPHARGSSCTNRFTTSSWLISWRKRARFASVIRWKMRHKWARSSPHASASVFSASSSGRAVRAPICGSVASGRNRMCCARATSSSQRSSTRSRTT
jgi:hypothetical protein